ncbi:MAG: NAD(P)-dependent oxidoreductase [Planctomycetota bacterium]|nr:MAG: NAD(P)-dependent oxidoreductase [Planctomycetota bacterium]
MDLRRARLARITWAPARTLQTGQRLRTRLTTRNPTNDEMGAPVTERGEILVTGARGLLARELMRRLRAEGRRVRGIDLPLDETDNDANITGGNLLDAASCRDVCRGVTTVVHAAARQYHGAPRFGRDAYFAVNVAMTRTLVDAAVKSGVRQLIYVSSDMVYGLPAGRPLRESDEPRPIGPYGESKLASERICASARASGMCVTILRPRMIIGAGRLGVLRPLFERVRRGAALPMIGDGSNRYQMVAVADVAAACCEAMARPIDGVFNLGSDDPPPIRELLAELARRAGSSSRLLPLPTRLSHAALRALNLVGLAPLAPEQYRIAAVDYVLDTRLAREQLGWRPRFRDEEMLCAAYHAWARAASTRRSATADLVGAAPRSSALTGEPLAPRTPAVSSASPEDG